MQAARRVARTVFLGSAPSSVATKPGIRGLDRARVLLGCLQPGQTSSLYSDALNRLADRLHYLNTSGDKTQDATRFWFDTRANLRREMEDRKKRFDDKNEVRGQMAEVAQEAHRRRDTSSTASIFSRRMPTCPTISALRLVVLPPEQFYSREEPRLAFEAVLDYVRNNGTKPRYRGNRLIFLAPDHGALARLRDCIRAALAWSSIVDDVAATRLVLDNLQAEQAEKELQGAEDVLPRVARECYKWLLCPSQDNPTEAKPAWRPSLSIPAAPRWEPRSSAFALDNEWVIATWSPIHLRTKLQGHFTGRPTSPPLGAAGFLGRHASLSLPAAAEEPRAFWSKRSSKVRRARTSSAPPTGSTTANSTVSNSATPTCNSTTRCC